MNKSGKIIRYGQCIVFLVLLIAGVTKLQASRLQTVINPKDDAILEQAKIQERKATLQLSFLERMPNFGFQNLLADWTFLNFLQYFGNTEYRTVTDYSLSADYFDIIIERDPYSYLPYTYLSSSISLFAGQPERAVQLQEKGLKSLGPGFPPKSYFIWRHKGIDEILFLDDYEAAARSHEIAADWAAESTDPRAEEDQYSLRRTAKFLAQNPDRTQVQISAWAQVLNTAPDQKTQAVAVENIEALGAEVVRDESGRYFIQRKQEDGSEPTPDS